MPRLARVIAPGVAHHITQRGNARRTVFETDSDRLAYLSMLAQYSREHRLGILGYCLMPNHIHLVALPHHDDSMARALHFTSGRYAAYLNARQQRTGHVWQARYYSCPLDERHLWNALRYTERNPVRAGLAADPESYPWSSAALHSGDEPIDGFVDLAAFRERWHSVDWRDFIALDKGDGAEADELRRRTRTGRPLGSMEFLKKLERRLHRTLVPKRAGRPPKYLVPIARPSVEIKISEMTGLSPN